MTSLTSSSLLDRTPSTTREADRANDPSVGKRTLVEQLGGDRPGALAAGPSSSPSGADPAVHAGTTSSGAASPGRSGDAASIQQLFGRPSEAAPPVNQTGLPDALKQGIEARSGFSLDDVRVHYNSPAPAAHGAQAFTQGTNIHVGPGQEAHLAHEAWHVVQQLQGRVQGAPGADGAATNEEPALEQEASAMGAHAAGHHASPEASLRRETPAQPVIQMAIDKVVQVAVPNVKQPKSNQCWATVGWSIHQFCGGTAYGSLKDFVDGQGSADSKKKFAKNQQTDVDQIIGSLSVTNRLSGSDSAGSYSKAVITKALNAGKPIVVNVDGQHYVILCGQRRNDGALEIELMDPASGAKSWNATTADTSSAQKITHAGAYSLSVLYYL